MERILGMKYDLDDFTIIPEKLINSDKHIESINTCHESDDIVMHNKLPILVVSDDNDIFIDNVHIIRPFWFEFDKPSKIQVWTEMFCGVSLVDLKEILKTNEIGKSLHDNPGKHVYIYIEESGNDINCINIVKQIKEQYGDWVVIMVDRVKTPDTFNEWMNLGDGIRPDYIALSSNQNSVLRYPAGSLIYECDMLRKNCGAKTKIIFDCGNERANDYDRSIKALALGADYCLLHHAKNIPWAPVKMWVEMFQNFLKNVMDMAGYNELEQFIGGPRLTIVNNHKHQK